MTGDGMGGDTVNGDAPHLYLPGDVSSYVATQGVGPQAADQIPPPEPAEGPPPSYMLPFEDDPIAEAWLGEAEDLIRQVDRLVGNASGIGDLMDPDETPAEWLPWLAQLAGVRLEDVDGETAKRRRLVEAPQRLRGTPDALAAAARRFMTGDRTIQIAEWTMEDGTSHPDWVRVRVYTDEAPTPQHVYRALMEAKPADVALAFELIDGETYETIAGEFDTYADMTEAFNVYDDSRIWRPDDE